MKKTIWLMLAVLSFIPVIADNWNVSWGTPLISNNEIVIDDNPTVMAMSGPPSVQGDVYTVSMNVMLEEGVGSLGIILGESTMDNFTGAVVYSNGTVAYYRDNSLMEVVRSTPNQNVMAGVKVRLKVKVGTPAFPSVPMSVGFTSHAGYLFPFVDMNYLDNAVWIVYDINIKRQ